MTTLDPLCMSHYDLQLLITGYVRCIIRSDKDVSFDIVNSCLILLYSDQWDLNVDTNNWLSTTGAREMFFPYMMYWQPNFLKRQAGIVEKSFFQKISLKRQAGTLKKLFSSHNKVRWFK